MAAKQWTWFPAAGYSVIRPRSSPDNGYTISGQITIRHNSNMHSGIEVESEGSRNTTLDVSSDWHRWCRLCAKADVRNINIFLKNENKATPAESMEFKGSGLSTAIDKYFNVEMKQDADHLKQLCTDCFLLITSLINFNERVVRVQKMYVALQHCHNNAVSDSQTLRLKYGVLEDDRPHEFMYRSNDITPQLHDHNYGQNILQEPHNDVEIKKENSNDGTYENEDPFGIDGELDNNGKKVCENTQTDSKKNNGVKLPTRPPNMSCIEKKLINSSNENNIRCHHSTKEDTTLTNNEKVSENSKTDSKRSDEAKLPTCLPNMNSKKRNVKSSRMFKGLVLYRNNMKRKHAKPDNAPIQYVCSKCSLSFTTPTQLLDHHSENHLTITKRQIAPCPYCEQKFPNKWHVGQHIMFVHKNRRSFICEECGDALRTQDQLKQHKLRHTDYAPFECEICKKCYKNEESVKKHMEIHDPNKHICHECGLQLSTRTSFKNHILVHSDVMQHKCDYCGQAFKRAQSLKKHLILHIGLKPYSCDFCDKTFADSSNCRAHKIKAHPDEFAAQKASGEKTFANNLPELALLKFVAQSTENLAPVASKPSGRFAFGKKPSITPDNIDISGKKRKLDNK